MHQRLCDPAAPCVLATEPRGAGAVVTLPPGSVVTADGNVVRTSFTLGIHRYDMARPNPIPGDLLCIDKFVIAQIRVICLHAVIHNRDHHIAASLRQVPGKSP